MGSSGIGDFMKLSMQWDSLPSHARDSPWESAALRTSCHHGQGALARAAAVPGPRVPDRTGAADDFHAVGRVLGQVHLLTRKLYVQQRDSLPGELRQASPMQTRMQKAEGAVLPVRGEGRINGGLRERSCTHGPQLRAGMI
eukprot:scaffold78591_cov18-Tisochrysis_lutea.AAC.1